MSNQNNLLPVEPEDTFAVWADKINAIQDFLVTTNFSTDEETVNLFTNQTINGTKTFNSNTILNGFDNQSGNFNLGGSIGNIICSTLNFDCPNGITFLGNKGLEFKSNSNAASIYLKYAAANIPSKLIFDYESNDQGIFEIATGNRLDLKDGKLGVGNIVWNLPTADPGSTSLLQWNNSGNNVSWKSYSDFTDEIVDDVKTALADSSLTLTVNLIPIGSTIDIDPDALNIWGTNIISDTLFPGWLRCTGELITRSQNGGEFNDLVTALTGGTTVASVNLPGTIGVAATKLIKYKQDPVTTFALKNGNGIEFLNSSTNTSLAGDLTLKGIGGRIGLKVNTNHFEFATGTGQLTIKNLTSGAVNSSIAQRTITGQLVASDPVQSTHLTTKAYVDAEIDYSRSSTTSIPEIIDGVCYADVNNIASLSIIDKFKNAFVWSKGDGLTSGSSIARLARSHDQLSAFSPITENTVKFKKTFISPTINFFVGEDDILYANGGNPGQLMGASSRGGTGTSINEQNFFSSWTISNPYSASTSFTTTLPGMLPIAAHWPAYAVSFEYATGLNGSTSTSSDPTNHNLTIKTKDGFDNVFVNNSGTQGFVKYFTNESDPIAYTRGYFISAGNNWRGQYGNNRTTIPNSPQVWAPDAWFPNTNRWEEDGRPGRILWDIYGRKESERSDNTIYESESVKREQIRKRFHWFKPNAVKTNGLDDSDAGALAEWRAQTGLSSNDSFSDYSWYIKKVIRSANNHFVIVGKPGDETTNECWVSGSNSSCALANGFIPNVIGSYNDSYDFVRLCEGRNNFSPGTFTHLNSTETSIFRRVDNQPHGFKDLEVFIIGSIPYYIVRGNNSRQNLTTQFRLFTRGHSAANELIQRPITKAGIYSSSTNQINTTSTVHLQALTGVIDIIVGSRSRTDESFYAIRATSNNVNTNALDALPQSQITSTDVYSWGSNLKGCLGNGSRGLYVNIPRLVTTWPSLFFSTSNGFRQHIIQIVASNNENAVFALDNTNKLYYAGDNTLGLADSINQSIADLPLTSDGATSFRETRISSTQRINKFFFIDQPDAPRIFCITQDRTNSKYYLYVGGTKPVGSNLGLSFDHYSAIFKTTNYFRITFPENPQNIISMCGADGHSLAFVKESNKEIGRLYSTGYPSGTIIVGAPYFTRSVTFQSIDREIV